MVSEAGLDLMHIATAHVLLLNGIRAVDCNQSGWSFAQGRV